MSDKLLHKDTWFEILLRLPMKTLVICACTWKTLNSYISSPDFIAAHLNKSKDNLLIFLRYDEETQVYKGRKVLVYKGTQLFGLHPDDESLNWDFNVRKMPLKTHARYLRIVGCCNGVICLSDDLEGYLNVTYLWNPSIKKHIQLPYPNITFSRYGPYDMFLGFGLDELANDFKVVRIVYLDDPDGYYTQLPLVEVYSVKSGSWRNIEISGPNAPKRYLFQFVYSQCYLNGAIHWLGRSDSISRFPMDWTDIVTFDVVDESFGVIKLPASLDSSCSVSKNFTVTTCRDKLALIHLHPEIPVYKNSPEIPVYKNSRVWVMKEYGVVDSWTPVFALTDPAMVPNFQMITFRKNEDMIMLVNNGTITEPCHVIQSVNAKTGMAKELGKHSGSITGFYLGLYEESLALFNEGKPTSDNVVEGDGAADNDVAVKEAENSDATDDDVEDNKIRGRVEDVLSHIATTMFRSQVTMADQNPCIKKGND